MIQTRAFAAFSANEPLKPYNFDRRLPKDTEVAIEIAYCGICHSDLHQIKNDWGGSKFPMVPGHEIVGKITHVGPNASKFKVGDLVGVGCLVDSCQTCSSCKKDLEQYCEVGFVGTYNGTNKYGETTYGGFSTHVVVEENFVLRVSDKFDLKAVAPLLCAGITTYSPLKHWKVGPGSNIAVVGLGGLGHMAIKIANALGATVTLFTTSKSKGADAKRLGAHNVVVSTEASEMKKALNSFDFILDTVSAPHDINAYLSCLKLDGTLVLVGLPDVPPTVQPFALVGKRRAVAGSLIGGIKETQEMLDFCAQHKIVSDIELIKPEQINEAFSRLEKSDVKYRFVIDWQNR